MLQLGTPAPDFTLRDHEGREVALGQFKGKQPVVLIFYPGDETPGCTKQLCTARDDMPLYEQAGVAVFGVNGGSQESHERFVARRRLTMPLLVDQGLAVAARYQAVMGIGPLKIVNRTVVGIRPDGTIGFYQRGMPSTQEILAALVPSSQRNAAKQA